MGKKKKSTVTRKKKAKQDAYLQAIIVIIISILLAVLIYGQTGAFGRGLSQMLGGLFGWIKYLIPIGAFVVGIILTKEQKEFVMPKIIQFLIVVLCVCGLMGLIQISSREININDDFGDIISQVYDKGTENKGGGAVGALIAIPMQKMVGTAAYVILGGAGILLTIFTFGIKPAELVDKMSTKLQESRNYEEEDDEEEEEELPPPPKTRRKEKAKKTHTMIVPDLFEDDEPIAKKKYDHDIPLAFEEKTPAEVAEMKSSQKIADKENSGEFIEANLFKEKKEEKEEKIKQELQLEHSQIEIEENYEFPPIALLEQGAPKKSVGKTAITDNALKLQRTLHSFGVSAKVEDVAIGPAITRYELKPAEGVRVSKIANLADDIALNLAAQSIRIEAPIPRKTSSAE